MIQVEAPYHVTVPLPRKIPASGVAQAERGVGGAVGGAVGGGS